MERRDFMAMSFWAAGAMKCPPTVGNLGIGSGTIDLDRLKLCADLVNAAFKSSQYLWNPGGIGQPRFVQSDFIYGLTRTT